MNSELFTVAEVSKKLKCNRNYVYALVKHGHLKALKLGHLKITNYDFDEFVRNSSGKDFSNLESVMELDVEEIMPSSC